MLFQQNQLRLILMLNLIWQWLLYPGKNYKDLLNKSSFNHLLKTYLRYKLPQVLSVWMLAIYLLLSMNRISCCTWNLKQPTLFSCGPICNFLLDIYSVLVQRVVLNTNETAYNVTDLDPNSSYKIQMYSQMYNVEGSLENSEITTKTFKTSAVRTYFILNIVINFCSNQISLK